MNCLIHEIPKCLLIKYFKRRGKETIVLKANKQGFENKWEGFLLGYNRNMVIILTIMHSYPCLPQTVCSLHILLTTLPGHLYSSIPYPLHDTPRTSLW